MNNANNITFEMFYDSLEKIVDNGLGDMPVSIQIICNEGKHAGYPILQTIGAVCRWSGSEKFKHKNKILLQTSVLDEPSTNLNRLFSAIKDIVIKEDKIGVQISKIAKNVIKDEKIFDINRIYIPKGNLWAQIEVVIDTESMKELKNEIKKQHAGNL